MIDETTRFVSFLNEDTIIRARAYEAIENEFSKATLLPSEESLEEIKKECLRKAKDLAISIDGLADRYGLITKQSRAEIIKLVQPYCTMGIGGSLRNDCLNRIRSVAVVHRHGIAHDPSLPIRDESDILYIGSSYGKDAYGVGKYSGEEVFARDASGEEYKFLADSAASIFGWFVFTGKKGLPIVRLEQSVLGIDLNNLS